MTMSGRIVKGHKTLYQADFADAIGQSASFHDKLENCLINLCRGADIPVPIWLSKNTTELARFRRTSFNKDQFAEAVAFDRFEIKIIGNVNEM